MVDCSVYQLYNAICEKSYDTIIIDARDQNEYFKSHIVGAINLTNELLMKSDMNSILKSNGIRSWSINSIYVYKNEHHLSTELMNQLSNINTNANIYMMKAGFNAFEKKFPFLCIQNEKSTIIKTNNYPSHIINDKLFIGNMQSAQNHDILKQLRITHILNVTADIPCYHQGNDSGLNIKYLQIFVDDHVNEDISIHFEEATSFIYNALNEDDNNRILIHCRQGISRSTSFVIAYLMKYNHQSFFDAEKYIKKRRSIIRVNDGFVTRLLEFEQLLRKQRQLDQNDTIQKYILTSICILVTFVAYHYLKSKL